MMDSPYVRRVAVSLALYGVEFESLPLSVFSGFDHQLRPVIKNHRRRLDHRINTGKFVKAAKDR
jgi:glutathione S-transferase